MSISYHANDFGREISRAEREAISAAVVADFIDGIRTLESEHEVKEPLSLAEINHLGFLKQLYADGKLSEDLS